MNMNRPRIPRPGKKTALTLIIVMAIVIAYFAFTTFTGSSCLSLYFKDTGKLTASGSNTLIVEYRNTEGEDLEAINIGVEAVHSQDINFPVKSEVHEENIGKGQLRQFEFPVNWEGLRSGSTYAIEVTVKTSTGNEISKRISMHIKGSG